LGKRKGKGKKKKEREKKEQEKEKNEDATSVSPDASVCSKYARSIFFLVLFGFVFFLFFFSSFWFFLSPSLSTLLKLLLYLPRSRPPSIVGPPRSRD